MTCARLRIAFDLDVDLLVDDSPHHVEEGQRLGLGARYVLVHAIGTPEDLRDPLSWAKQVRVALERSRRPA